MPPKRNRQRQQLIVTASVVGVLALGVLLVALTQLSSESAAPPTAANPIPTSPPSAMKEAPPDSVAPPLVADDGRTLWAPPPGGEGPIPLEGVPPGSRLILSFRPARMLDTSDGQIVLEHFKAPLQRLLSPILTATKTNLQEAARVTVACRADEAGRTIDTTIVLETSSSVQDDFVRPRIIQQREGQGVGQFSNTRFVSADSATLEEVMAIGGDAPPLTREMEQLAARSEASRHVTLLVAPSFLFAEGSSLLTGDLAALKQPLLLQVSDDLRAMLLSVHWLDDSLYWEARAASAAETTAARMAGSLSQQLSGWPGDLQLALLDLNPAPHGRRVVANLPAMVRMAADYARWGVEDRQAVINGYLPPLAGHNLLLAADLMLAQQSADGGSPTTASQPSRQPQAAKDRLQQRVSVSFARDTLEMALRYLSDEIDVPIVILGSDLQLEGITKNQSFGLDAASRPGEAVLLEILTRANPDKTATGPRDLKQKLVFVIKPNESGNETIYVTTRASAKKRGDRLPSVFQP